MNILEIIFPRYCVNCKKYGEYLCSDCFSRLSYDTRNICLVCGKPSFDGLTHPSCIGKYIISGSFTGVVYNGIAKKLLYQFKYKPYLYGLSSFITELLYESIIQNEEFDKVLKQVGDDVILVPIPLSLSKFKKRGYNQSELLAKNLAKKLGFSAVDLLERTRDTKSQFNLSKEERKKNMVNAFGLKRQFESELKNNNLFLVDDVLTTGSTLSEAAKILKKNGAKEVWGIAFAREQ